MWLGNNTVLRMVCKNETKNCSQGISVFGVKVWRNWMDAYHIAGGEPISLWGERIGPSYELVLLTAMGLPPDAPSLCWGHFPAWAGGGRIFSSVELFLWGFKLHTDLKKRGLCLPQPCLGFSLGRQPRTGFGWGYEHLPDNFARVWIGVNFSPCLSLPVD